MFSFLKENYQWLFSGIGVPLLFFIGSALKKMIGGLRKDSPVQDTSSYANSKADITEEETNERTVSTEQEQAQETQYYYDRSFENTFFNGQSKSYLKRKGG